MIGVMQLDPLNLGVPVERYAAFLEAELSKMEAAGLTVISVAALDETYYGAPGRYRFLVTYRKEEELENALELARTRLDGLAACEAYLRAVLEAEDDDSIDKDGARRLLEAVRVSAKGGHR